MRIGQRVKIVNGMYADTLASIVEQWMHGPGYDWRIKRDADGHISPYRADELVAIGCPCAISACVRHKP